MKKLNWEIILSNLGEAREQIELIEARVKSGEKVSEIELQIWIEHVYHHLNFAWNVRHVSTKRYSRLKDEEFNLWSKFPEDIEVYKLPEQEQV